MNAPLEIPMGVAATSITLYGIATGLSYEVLLAGFAGGLVSISFLEPMGLWQRIWTPVTATITAGYTAPIVKLYLAGLLGLTGMEAPKSLTLLVGSAFLIGVATQVALPAFTRMVRRLLDNRGARTP